MSVWGFTEHTRGQKFEENSCNASDEGIIPTCLHGMQEVSGSIPLCSTT